MHRYLYTGVHVSGKAVTGEVAARSRSEAISLLRKRNLRAVSVWSRASKPALWLLSVMRARDVSLLTAQLASMLSTGLAPADCLDALVKRIEHWKIRRCLRMLASDVRNGVPVAQALARYPALFDPFYRKMVATGETRGKLAQAFSRLARFCERNYAIRRKVRSTLTYPILFGSMGVLGVAFMLTIVVPKFVIMFEMLEAEMPLPTGIIIATSHFVQQYLPAMVAAGLVLGAVGTQLGATKTGRMLRARMRLELPLVGDLERKVLISHMLQATAALCSTGTEIDEAGKVAAESVTNGSVRQKCAIELRGKEREPNLNEILGAMGIFPPMLAQVIEKSKNTGDIVPLMERVSVFYDEEVEATVDAFNSVIEPALILVLGLIVGAILVAMYLPMLAISSSS